MDRHAHPLFFSVDPQTGLEAVVGGTEAPGNRRHDLDRPAVGVDLEGQRRDSADANEIGYGDLCTSNREVENPDLQDPEASCESHGDAKAVCGAGVLNSDRGVAVQQALDERANRLRLAVEFDPGEVTVDSVHRELV